MFITVEQCKRIINGYLTHSGRGGFMTGVVKSVAPLIVTTDGQTEVIAADLYVTDSCIGLLLNLEHGHNYEDTEKDGEAPTDKDSEKSLRNQVVLRRGLAPGDGVLLLCRPDNIDGVKYVLLDRIQSYMIAREVNTL